MNINKINVVDDVQVADIAELEDRIDDFNAATTGLIDARHLSILLRRPGDGELYAGLHGHTWGDTCEIKLLWIEECNRGKGLGTALLDAAEIEARRRGCQQIVLSTHSFQAPHFYTNRGYKRIATLADYPIGFLQVLMLKKLFVRAANGRES